jgi:hypothetical protein
LKCDAARWSRAATKRPSTHDRSDHLRGLQCFEDLLGDWTLRPVQVHTGSVGCFRSNSRRALPVGDVKRLHFCPDHLGDPESYREHAMNRRRVVERNQQGVPTPGGHDARPGVKGNARPLSKFFIAVHSCGQDYFVTRGCQN